MRLAAAVNMRRHLGGAQLQNLDWMAYSGIYNSNALDAVTTALTGKRFSKGLAYYVASLYLQLGETDKASDLMRSAGRASREMTWFSMLLLHCRMNGLACPTLTNADEKCLQYLQEKYTGCIGYEVPLSGVSSDAELIRLFRLKGGFAVIGNAPSISSHTDNEFLLSDESVSTCFNNYHLNSRINGIATVHVVTPSWKAVGQIPARHLVVTGNSIFYRRSKVWRRFSDCPGYVGIHTVPRLLWSSLVERLQAPPSAGLLMLSYLQEFFDLTAKRGLIAGFSNGVPVQNHSFDRVPAADAHNWELEDELRLRVLQEISNSTLSLQITP